MTGEPDPDKTLPLPARPPSDAPAPPAGARYRFGGELGRGALGRVVEGWDSGLERSIAVKLVIDHLAPELAERFVREARLAARLEHPNIVPVYDLGTLAGGQLFLCMKRIQGRDLRKVLEQLGAGDEAARREFTRTRLLMIFQDICLGVAFAHGRGVIHRDLKPSNVMIGDYGEVLVVDWGLAREIGDGGAGPAVPGAVRTTATTPHGTGSSAMTLEGEIVGTPAYMPPEQAEGRLADLDARCDIYSLGAILYELLALAPAFSGATALEVLSRVRSGRFDPPSARVPGIPRELDSIVLRAMALRREDRHPSALDLHHDVQLFLEGVKERERSAQEAGERVEAGRASLGRYRELAGELAAQERAVRDLFERIKPHEPLEAKRPLWDAQARLRALEEEQIEAYAKASAEFGQALVVDPASPDAADGRCELLLDRFLDAERRRDRKEVLLHRKLLLQHDRTGAFRRRLEAPGTLSLRAWVFDCRCLAPVRDPAWRVEIGEKPLVPWRDGRARPDLPLEDRDRPVVEERRFPAGACWGHTSACARREIAAEVRIARYEERDQRYVPGPERSLGATPLAGAELPQGAYRCTLRAPGFADTLLSVRIDRGGAWSQDATLYRPAEIPPGFALVSGGPFISGGEQSGGPIQETRTTRDVFVARLPVTAGEYLFFLNALRSSGRLDEARRRQLREGDGRFLRETPDGFTLPPEREALLNTPDHPAIGLSWFDAVAYAAWRSTRDGLAYTLLHEDEFEKAARGADGRIYPWGDAYDGTFSHSNVSLAGPARPLPVGTFATDESLYGIRDLAGGACTWLLNAPEAPMREYFCFRGGAFSSTHSSARCAYRQARPPGVVFRHNGMRLALRPIS